MRHTILLAALAACAPTTTSSSTNSSTTPPADFACGDQTCSGDQYCEVFTPGVPPETGEVEVEYTCVDAPASCSGVPDCTCVASEEACSLDCQDDGDGVICDFAAP